MKQQSMSFQMARKRRRREGIVAGILFLIWCGAALFLLTHGDKNYTIIEVLRVLTGEKIKGVSYAVGTIRLPKVIVGTLAGFAFGAAGNTFQKIMRNALASPDVLGISSGASFFAVFAMLVLGLSGFGVSILALVGGVVTAFLILRISGGDSFSVNRMILTGIGLQAMMLACINFIILKTAEYDVAAALRWLSGSLNGSRMKDVPFFLVMVVGFALILVMKEKEIKVLELGEELPVTLGMKVSTERDLILQAAVVLCAVSVAVTGPLASVAFMAGPISQRVLRTGNVGTIAAGMTGAVITLVAEIIGQFALGTRYPVGVITGIIGAPYLIFLLVKMNQNS